VDLLPPTLLVASASAVRSVPPIVLEVFATGLRLRQVAVMLRFINGLSEQ